MARGWESKSIEAQQAEASEDKQATKPRLTAEESARRRQLDGLLLSQSRVLQQLKAAHDPRHQEMLQHALADLNQKIQKLQ